MYVRKLIKWNLMGKGIAEDYINQIVPSGEYKKLDSKTINEILEIKGYLLRILDGKELYL